MYIQIYSLQKITNLPRFTSIYVNFFTGKFHISTCVILKLHVLTNKYNNKFGKFTLFFIQNFTCLVINQK